MASRWASVPAIERRGEKRTSTDWSQGCPAILKRGPAKVVLTAFEQEGVWMQSTRRDLLVDYGRFASPFGTILYAHSGKGLAALGFGEELEELSIPHHFQPSGNEVPSEVVENALAGYFDGSAAALDQVDLDLAESGFYSLCRAELRKVPFGQTVTYKGLAALAGNPKAYRAAASACSTNPIPLFVPCHRVVSSDGSLGGYAFGTALKASLLKFEANSVGD